MCDLKKVGRGLILSFLMVSQVSWAVDLGVNIDQTPAEFEPGSSQSNAYEFTVSKANGSADVDDIVVNADFNGSSGAIATLTWTCTAQGGSSCDSGGDTINSSDDFDVTVSLSGDGNDVVIAITNVTFNSDIFSDLAFQTTITDFGETGGSTNIDAVSSNNDDSDNIARASVTDLNIEVTDSQTSYVPGSAASYTITVSNSGPSEAQSVNISDGTPPADLNITGWTCSADPNSSCSSASGGSNVFLSVDLADDEEAQILVTGTYDSDATANPLVYTVTAAITDNDASDPDGVNPTDSDSNTRTPTSNLSIDVDTSDTGHTTYTPGASETYVITVTNTGPSDVSGITVVDNNPSEFDNISWTCSADAGSSCGAASGSTAINTTVNLDDDDSAVFTVTVDYDSAATTPTLTYSATATNPSGQGGTSPVTDNKDLDVLFESNLTVTLDDSATTYVPGLSGTFTAVVTNTGPSDVNGVLVEDSNLTEISSISWTCSVTDPDSNCLAGPDTDPVDTNIDLVAGDAATFVIDVDYLSSADTNPLVYTVTATLPAGVTGTSGSGTDNDDVLDRRVDLSLTKSTSSGILVEEDLITYSIVIANAGPSDLGSTTEQGVQLLDQLDGTLGQYISECSADSIPCWKYCPSDQGVPNSALTPDANECDAGVVTGSDPGGNLMDLSIHLAAGSSSEIRVYAQVTEQTGSNCDPGTAATRELCNTVTATLTAPNTTNTGTQIPLDASVSNEIIVATDLIVNKTDGLTDVSPGAEISYTVTVRNDKFKDVDGITVSDVLPLYPAVAAGFEPGSISWVCETEFANACCVSQTPTCGFNAPVNGPPGDELMATIDLGGESEVVFTVTGTISNEASGILSNTASAELPAGVNDINPNNNAETDTTNLVATSDVSVTKSLTDAEVNAVDDSVTDLSYEIIVTNNGPAALTDIDVVDLLDDSNYNLATAEWECTIQGTGSCDDVGSISGMAINTEVDLAVGATATFDVSVSTNPFSQGSVVNTVAVTVAGDPVPINNTASVEYALSGTSQIRINNDDSTLFATPGLTTNYTISVENEGPDNVFGATVEDIFPAELTDVEWTCSAISPIPGDLTLFQPSDQTVNGTLMLLSPDGSHVYVASPDTDGMAPFDHRLYVFKRETNPGATYGQFVFVEFLTQGDGSIDGLEDIKELQMSSDGNYLYVLSSEPSDPEGAITVFSRNNIQQSPDYGKLTYLNSVTDQMPVDPVDMLISPDQKHIYLTGDGEIYWYDRDTNSGLLTYASTLVPTDASHLVSSADGSHLYVVDETSNQVVVYERNNVEADAGFGDLTNDGDVMNADITGVTDMIISADQRNLYLAAAGVDKLVVLTRNLSTGSITHTNSYDDTGLGFIANETLVGMHRLSVSDDGEHLYVSNPVDSDNNDGRLLSLSRNSQGLLSKDQELSLLGMEGLSDVVITADGRQVLATAKNGKTLLAFDRRQPDPTFSFVEVEIDGQDSEGDAGGIVDGLLGASAVVSSLDGLHVYTAGIGDNSISVFSRDKSKGSTSITRGQHLSFITAYTDGVNGVSDISDVNSLALSPNGDFLYAGSRDESTLAVFSRAADGTLTFETSYSHVSNVTDGLLGVSDIAIDSTTQNLYVVGQFEASIAHYSIDGSGGLTLVDAIANGDVGVSGMGGARSIVITPDEDHVIVGSGIDDSVVVFDRDPGNGQLAFRQHLAGVGDQPMDVAISPDGEHVYVASANDSRLTVINRNNNTSTAEYGQLSINISYIDNVGGFTHLQGLRAVVVSPNGEKVYAGAEFDAAVSVLDRDTNPNSASFGRLAVVEVQVDDVDGINGLNQLYELAVSRDSKNVYAVGFGDNALAAFVLGTGSSCSAQGSGNINDLVDIGSNGTLTYSVSGTIRSNATGVITTEARILPPDNFTFTNPLDNCATPAMNPDDNCDQDTTTLVPVTDLSISKTNNRLSSVAGEAVSYTVTVSNAGPSDANSNSTERVMVKDVLDVGFEPGSASWTCEAIGSGSLSFVDAVINDVDNVQGLTGVTSLNYSDNLAGLGPHVLATSVNDNNLLAFSVDVMDGSLSQVLPLVTATPGISLQGARDVLVIDNDIYVASQVDDSLVAFKANNSTGLDIQWVDNHQFPGMDQAVSVTASADGEFVYVTGANDDAVVIFDRQVGTGVLTYSATVTGGSQGLNGVNTMAISNNGFSVYTSGFNDNELGTYKRDELTGDLTFVEVLNTPEVTLAGVSSIAISPLDKHVYVTSAANHKLYVFERDTSAPISASDYGVLTWVQTIEQGAGGVTGLLQPSDVLVSADGRHVYVSSEQSDAVVWFGRDETTGELVYGGLVSDLIASVDGLDGALALATDTSGQYIYVAGSEDHGIAVLTRTADSHCPAAGSGNVVEMDGSIEAGVPVDLAVNGKLIFTVNATVAADATGTLVNEARVLSCMLPLTDPVESCLGSDPNVGNNLASDEDSLNPTADLSISKTDGISIYEGLAGATQVTGDGQYFYVAGSQDNAISMFRREVNTGSADFGNLTYQGQLKNGVDGVSGLLGAADVIISDDGNTVYAAGSGDNSVVVFSKANTGLLTYVEKHSSGVFGVTGIEGVAALNLSPDGAHLYATGPLTNSLAVFAIDQSGGEDHGKLTFIQSLQNGVGGVAGLANISDVTISNDNNHAYVTSESGHSVSLFLRNPNDASVTYGQLTYQSTYSNGVNGVAGLMGANSIISDANSDYIYVLGAVDQALAVFNRDDTDGALTFVEFKQNGTSNVVGLNLAKELIISNDQLSLYVAGRGENALVRFNRDTIDGTLTFGDVINDGDPLPQPGTSVDGLSGVAGLFMSNDDAHLYVVADQDDAISIYSRDNLSAPPQLGALDYQDVLLNGRGGISPGAEVTYVIVARNNGPSDVFSARVVDNFPAAFESVTYQCFPLNGAGCNTTPGNSNVDINVDLPVGSQVEIIATGVIRPDASGVISNTATVMPSTNPALAVSDPDLTNNTATDDDTVLFVAADLVVTKDNGVNTSIPGAPVSYNITVTNDAVLPGNSIPADVTGVSVVDSVPEAISDVSWTCQAFPQPGLLDDGDGDPGTDAYLSFTDLEVFDDMVVHANGDWAYVVGMDNGESVLLVYQRNNRSGELLEIERFVESDTNINGLAGASALSLSPNGNQLYVVADGDDALTTWTVDAQTGQLTYTAVAIDGIAGVNGLGGANDVLVTHDGIHVYVAGKADNGIAIFNRNIGTGALTYNSILTGVEGLSGVHEMVQSGDYLVVIAEANQSIATFTRSVQNGLLVAADVIQDFELPGSVLEQPRAVALTSQAVIVASYGSDAVAMFDLNADDGLLTALGVIRQGDAGVTHLEGPEGLVTSADGQSFYVASSVSSAIMLFDWIDGAFVPASTIYDTALIPDLDGVNQLTMDGSGTHLYGLSDELVLTAIQNGSSCTSSGSGQLADVADIVSNGYLEYTLTGTLLPTATGLLENTATALMTGENVELNPADNSSTDVDNLVPTSDLSLSKTDGLTEVVAGTDLVYDIAVFSAGPSAMSVVVEDLLPVFPTTTAGFESQLTEWTCTTGRTLQENGIYEDDGSNGLASGEEVIESPDGLFVYVISDLGTVAVYSKDTSGILTFVQLISEADELPGGTVTGLVGATAATMDADGQHIYVVSTAGNQMVVLDRNETTGELDYNSTASSGEDGVFGMLGPVQVVVSPDGGGVYVAAYESDAITVFSRDLEDGSLVFVERVKDGFGTIVPESNVIIEITDLVISADGKYLYTAADFSEAIAVFSRDDDSQVLTFVEVIRSGDMHGGLSVPGMTGTQSMIITNNGDFVYTAVQGSSSLLRFKRNASDGSLEFEAQWAHGDVGVGSLEAPNDLEITPNGGRLLVADSENSSVSIYDRNTVSGDLTLVDDFTVSVLGTSQPDNLRAMTTDGTNVFVVLHEQNSLYAIRITADAECLTESETSDTPLIPLYMSPGSAADIQVAGHVHPSARGTINNLAQLVLTPDSNDTNFMNNSDIDDTLIVVETDVSLTKTGPTEAIAGEVITYQINLTNSGPSDALDVVVNDSFASGIINADWTCVATGRSVCSNASGTGNISETVNVTIDGDVTFLVDATINPAFNGTLVNEAAAVVFEMGFNTDTDLNNNNDQVITEVTQVADLSITKDNGTTTVVAGEMTSYQISVTNPGPSDGQSVLLDLMPVQLEQVTWQCTPATGSTCTASGSGDINDMVYLAANSSLVYQVDGVVSSAATGQLINEALIEPAVTLIDPDLSNNSVQDIDQIDQVADVSVTLTDLIDPYDPGSPLDLSYHLEVVNIGPSDATNVLVNLPEQLDVTADTVNVCSTSATGVNCEIGYAIAGETYEFIVNYRLNPALTGQINNLAEATLDTFDPELNNNVDTTVTDLISGTDVRVSQSNGETVAEPGQTLTYEIIVENIGSQDAGEVNIVESLPAELINASWNCEALGGATCININQSGLTGGADLPSGGRVIMTLVATVDPNLPEVSNTEINNTVEAVLITETDFNLLNNTSTSATPVVFFIFKDGFDEVVP